MTEKLKDPSEFAKAALELDAEFASFGRLSAAIERAALRSEGDLDHALALLSQFEEASHRISTGIQELARTLNEAREGAERAAQVVGERAGVIQQRQQTVLTMIARFRALGEMVAKVTELVAELRPAGSQASAADQDLLRERLPEMNQQIDVLIGQIRSFVDDAKAAELRSIERNADSLRQSLQAARNRLNIFVEQQLH